MKGPAEGMIEAVAPVGGEEEDVGGKGGGRGLGEDAFALGAEAAEGNAEGKGDEGGGVGRIVFGGVRREGGAVWAVDGVLGPGLRVAPWRPGGALELA